MLATALQGRNAANIPLPTGLATFSQPQLAMLLAPILSEVQLLIHQGSIAEAAALVQREAEQFRARRHILHER